MRFKLDENLPTELVSDLHELGHDADTVMDEKLHGASDPVVVQAASAAGRVLLTLDKGSRISSAIRSVSMRAWFCSGQTHWGGALSLRLCGSVFKELSSWI